MAAAPSSSSSASGPGPSATKDAANADLELGANTLPVNTTVHSLAWKDVTVTVKDRETKQQKTIIDNVSGYVEAGMAAPFILPTPFPPHQPSTSQHPFPPSPFTSLLNPLPSPPVNIPLPLPIPKLTPSQVKSSP